MGALNLPGGPVLVSACLLGEKCRYDGTDCRRDDLSCLLEGHRVACVCPETAGGLLIPRSPAEIRGGDGTAVLSGRAVVLSPEGHDLTEWFLAGAHAALEQAKRLGAMAAVLKERSPSCGVHQIYDGTFSRQLTAGRGVAAALLAHHGIALFSEADLDSRSG